MTSHNLRVVHIFNSSVISGPEILVVPSLAKLDIDCTVVWLTEERLRQSQDVAGYSAHFGLSTKALSVRRRFDLRAIRELGEFLRSIAPDIVHAHDVKASLYALLARKWVPKAKLVSTHHGVRGRSGFVARAYERIYSHCILPRFDLSLTVCGSDKEILERIPRLRGRVQVHWNGIDSPLENEKEGENPSSQQQAVRERIRLSWGIPLSPESLVVGIVGRLAAEKRIDFALSVFEILVRRNPKLPVTFVIVGTGPLRNALERKVVELDLTRQVSFLGYREKFGGEIAGLDVLLSLSRAEGLPINVLEAGYARVPVVCTRIDGLADLFPSDAGFPALEPEASSEVLASELAKLLVSRESRIAIGDSFHDRVKACFSGDAWRSRLYSLYLEVVRSEMRVR
ncbi:MAG: glycosyltransferase family 4 protein [Bdellovibrionales bacterium]|nr:glycosyltransferase family 4 protein [Bdellovibrionales bacterium]